MVVEIRLLSAMASRSAGVRAGDCQISSGRFQLWREVDEHEEAALELEREVRDGARHHGIIDKETARPDRHGPAPFTIFSCLWSGADSHTTHSVNCDTAGSCILERDGKQFDQGWVEKGFRRVYKTPLLMKSDNMHMVVGSEKLWNVVPRGVLVQCARADFRNLLDQGLRRCACQMSETKCRGAKRGGASLGSAYGF